MVNFLDKNNSEFRTLKILLYSPGHSEYLRNLLTEVRSPYVKSTTPPTGRTTSPTAPWPSPFMNPGAPLCCAPCSGRTTTPVTPSTKPWRRRGKDEVRWGNEQVVRDEELVTCTLQEHSTMRTLEYQVYVTLSPWAVGMKVIGERRSRRISGFI